MGDLRDSREWPPILIKGRCITNYEYLRIVLDRQIRSDADTPCAINFAAKPFAGRRWSNSCCPDHRLARNPLIINERAFSIDCLNCFLQPHIYAQLQ
jgi:hypothetical protein